MATLVLSAVGTAIGGPIGGTIGAFLGQQVDGRIFGPGPAEGPRLKELALTTSTYGQPIARQFGQMRVGGTVIWATDLKEDKDTSGGKGRPKTTTYSYSASFAVMLSSGPVDRVGRIWADGNLLRGAAGDLKAAGAMRFHSGRGDQRADPLLLAALGARCPAYRGRSYVVFEDLQLADFGNRLPALTFEVFAGDGAASISALLHPADGLGTSAVRIPQLKGYSHDGGTYRQVLSGFAELHPIHPVLDGGMLRIAGEENEKEVKLLAPAAAWKDGEFGQRSGQAGARKGAGAEQVEALRYYDLERDYQPGLQRTAGRYEHARSRQIEFPGSMSPAGARELADAAAQRSRAAGETLTWRVAELDPHVQAGTLVRAPGHPGVWRVQAWEWREGGVELELVRHVAAEPARQGGDAGAAWSAADLVPGPTLLRFLELPPVSVEDAGRSVLFAAVQTRGTLWKGAALYRNRQGELVPLEQVAERRAAMGRLASPLPSSPAVRFEPAAWCDVTFAGPPPQLAAADLAGLAEGANRVLIGGEVVQFAEARLRPDGAWRLTGLLRGRAGTEHIAHVGQPGGAPVVLLNGDLVPLEPGSPLGATGGELGAIGLGDAEPVFAPLENAGASRRPLPPVHGRLRHLPDGRVELSWTRRARGAWLWPDGVDVPLVEEAERYEVGIGDVAAPVRSWTVSEPRLLLDAATKAELTSAGAAPAMWVRQVGSYALSPATLVGSLG